MAYDNPAGLIAAAVVVEAIVAACVGIRLYGRRKYSTRLLTADWLIVAAFVCSLGLTVLHVYGVAIKSLGTPLGDTFVNADGYNDRFQKTQYINVAFLLIGNLTLGLIKLSASFFYLRIFSFKPSRTIIIGWIVILICWTITAVVGALLQCGVHFMALFGTAEDSRRYCYPQTRGIGFAWQALNLTTDIVTLLLPLPMVWALHIAPKRKAAISMVFMIGLLSVGAGTAKAYYYIASSLRRLTADPIVLVTALSTWNLVESQVGIIAACLITMRRILKDLFPTDGLSRLLASLSSIASIRSRGGSQTGGASRDNSPGRPQVGPSKADIELLELQNKGAKSSEEMTDERIDSMASEPSGAVERV